MNTTQTLIIDQIQKIAQKSKSALRSAVALEIIDHTTSDDEVRSFLSDLFQHGCISGMVGSLIYYHDTHKFFETHYDEIELIRQGYEETTGEPLIIKDDLKNRLAWFAFDETAYKLAEELSIDL